MGKELPYFKFEPNQWENGNIQICSREDKGLFMDVCSMYWSRLGVLPLKLAVQKLCNGNATALDTLISEGILFIKNELIYIEFLNEQLQCFEDKSETNRKNALERWEKQRKLKEESKRNATASKPQSESDAIREEKIKEDKKKEENKNKESLPLDDCNYKKWNEEQFKEKVKTFSQYESKVLQVFFNYWSEFDQKKKLMKFQKQQTWETSKRLVTWTSKNY